MDTGRGSFAEVSEIKASQVTTAMGLELSGVFRVGEIIEIRGSRFRVERIKTRGLRLLLLPDNFKG